MTNIKIGLVMSGGGVRGMAHIGVIKALHEHEIFPTIISGASSGAIVGAFYAADYTPEEIFRFFKETTMFSFKKYLHRKPGILDTDKFYKIFKPFFPADRFEALKKSLYISATDILAGTSKIFHEGPLIKAMLASAAFPVVLSPLLIDNTYYADGGITNNFPIEPLIGKCDKICGVFANPLSKIKPEELNSAASVLERAFKIGMTSVSIPKFKQCDLLIAPEELNQFNTFGMNHLNDAYEIGYHTASKILNQKKDLFL